MKKLLLSVFLLAIQTCANADPEPTATIAISQITMRSEAELQADLEAAGFGDFASKSDIVSSLANKTLSPLGVVWKVLRFTQYYFEDVPGPIDSENPMLQPGSTKRILDALLSNDAQACEASKAELDEWNAKEVCIKFSRPR